MPTTSTNTDQKDQLEPRSYGDDTNERGDADARVSVTEPFNPEGSDPPHTGIGPGPPAEGRVG